MGRLRSELLRPPGVLALGLELIPDGFVLCSLSDLGSGISPLPTGGYLEHQPADFSGIDLVAVHLHGLDATGRPAALPERPQFLTPPSIAKNHRL